MSAWEGAEGRGEEEGLVEGGRCGEEVITVGKYQQDQHLCISMYPKVLKYWDT